MAGTTAAVDFIASLADGAETGRTRTGGPTARARAQRQPAGASGSSWG